MDKSRFFISTTASDADSAAREFGLGIEIAEYCTAWNIDLHFTETHAAVTKKLEGVENRILHAPFNELFPCAIDLKVRDIARSRYTEAIALARRYGAKKVVIHGGHNPWLYYPVWYVEQSIPFWQDFMKTVPDSIEICLENVLEDEPYMLRDIVKAVDHPQLKLCLDVGHANAYSKVPVLTWLREFAPWLSHLHIHNNRGASDEHNALYDGTIPMADFIKAADDLCPGVTFTMELYDSVPSVRYLLDENIL